MYEKLTMFLPVLGEVYVNWAEIHVKQPSMPFVVYETAARQLIDAIRDYVRQHNEYAEYGQILHKAGIEWNYDSMSEADASILDGKTIIALLVGAVQAEKFCDGASSCSKPAENGRLIAPSIPLTSTSSGSRRSSNVTVVKSSLENSSAEICL